jgi:hypothetical protein
MSGFSHRLWFWVLGVTLAAASVAGTGLVVASRPGDGTGAHSAVPTGAAVTCFGYIDVEDGVVSLYPLQPGRVERVCVYQKDEHPW